MKKGSAAGERSQLAIASRPACAGLFGTARYAIEARIDWTSRAHIEGHEDEWIGDGGTHSGCNVARLCLMNHELGTRLLFVRGLEGKSEMLEGAALQVRVQHAYEALIESGRGLSL